MRVHGPGVCVAERHLRSMDVRSYRFCTGTCLGCLCHPQGLAGSDYRFGKMVNERDRDDGLACATLLYYCTSDMLSLRERAFRTYTEDMLNISTLRRVGYDVVYRMRVCRVR